MKLKYLRFVLLCILILPITGSDAQTQKKYNRYPQKKQSAPGTIGFDYYQSLIFIKAKINGSRTQYVFLMNTGANTTVIDKKTADIIKLPVVSELDSVEGTAGMEYVTLCRVKSLNVGNVSVKDLRVTKRDLSKFVTLDGRKIDGILGTDFLKHFAVTIDFNNKKIAFTTKKTTIDKQRNIPFEVVDGIPRFTVKLNDTFDTYLHYNSGVSMAPSRNNYINVSYNQWGELKKMNPNMSHANYFSGMGVGGSVYMEVVKIHNMQLYDMEVKNPYVIVQSKEGYFKRDDAIGFFSNNLLEKEKMVTIDFLAHRVVFPEPKRTVTTTKKGAKKKSY